MRLARKQTNKLKKTWRKKIIPNEFEEQVTFVQFLDRIGLKYYHIPNGGKRNVIEGAKFKRSGVKRGVPDVCIPQARKPFYGLYIELKRKSGNRPTIEQLEWIDYLTKAGYLAKIAYGAEEAIEIVLDYLKLPKW